MPVARNEKKVTLPGTSGQAKALPSLSKAEAARQLGVTRTHLSLVLNGHRRSQRLQRRYRQLVDQLLPA